MVYYLLTSMAKPKMGTCLAIYRHINYHLPAYVSKIKVQFPATSLARSHVLGNKICCLPILHPRYNSQVWNTGIFIRNFSSRYTSPYNASRDFSRDIPVYSYENKTMIRYLTIFGVIQFILWVNVSSFFYELFNAVDKKNKKKEEEKTLLQRLFGLQTKYKYSSSIFCLMVAGIVLLFTWGYPLRTVHKLTLLTGGRNLRVTTYYHFGMTRDINIPLEHISFNASRQYRKDSTLSAKIKGKWFYFLVDTRSGKFHHPEVFDHVVGLERKL